MECIIKSIFLAESDTKFAQICFACTLLASMIAHWRVQPLLEAAWTMLRCESLVLLRPTRRISLSRFNAPHRLFVLLLRMKIGTYSTVCLLRLASNALLVNRNIAKDLIVKPQKTIFYFSQFWGHFLCHLNQGKREKRCTMEWKERNRIQGSP